MRKSFDRILYYGIASQSSIFNPHSFEFYDRHYYLIAYSHNSGQIHDFRVDRIDEIDTVHRLPPEHINHERPLITFRYRLAELLARGEVSQRFEHQQVVGRLSNGDVVIEAQGRSEFFIVRTLLKYAGSAELLAEGSPPELVKQMRESARDIYRLYHNNDC